MESDPAVDLGPSRSVGQILRSTLALYTAYPWLFLVLAAAVMAPWDLVKLLIPYYDRGRLDVQKRAVGKSAAQLARLLVDAGILDRAPD